jgi:hypothetical protein
MLFEGLKSAFPDFGSLERMAQFRLGFPLREVTAERGMNEVVFALMRHMRARSQIGELLLSALEWQPTNVALARLASEVGIGSVGGDAIQVEALLRKSCPPVAPAQFLARLAEQESRVCWIQMGTLSGGTGFLVSPDLVLTNAHVADVLRTGAVAAADVTVRFDYRTLADGTLLSPGRVVTLQENAILDWSPPDPADLATGTSANPAEENLDYALLALTEPVGNEPVGAQPQPGAAIRGWLKASPGTAPKLESPLFILQHPGGAPLQMAWGGRVVGVNANGTRVRHDVDTDRGSSGSPVFDCSLSLVAVHHAGSAGANPPYNQAIPVGRILSLLHARGHTSVFA